MEIYKKTEFPIRKKDKNGKELNFSVDVFGITEDNEYLILQYDFILKEWRWDCNWDLVWMYPPEELKFIK